MQDENVACHDIGKLSFERAVGCFGTPQLERATRFPMPQLERATCFAMPQLECATRFPNVPSRARDLFRMIASSESVFGWVVFTIIITFCHSMPFMSMYLIVLIKAQCSQHVAFIC